MNYRQLVFVLIFTTISDANGCKFKDVTGCAVPVFVNFEKHPVGSVKVYGAEVLLKYIGRIICVPNSSSSKLPIALKPSTYVFVI